MLNMSSLSMVQSLNRCFLWVFLVFLCINSLSCAGAQRKASGDFIDFQVNSLLPHKDLTCKHSPRGNRQGVSLEVVHRHGPCSKLKSGSSTKHGSPSHSELLLLDQDRVDLIHARLTGQSGAGDKVQLDSSSANLPARSSTSIGSGNYVVKVGLGTPNKDLHLVFDTGSDITWTQCKPCHRTCYHQTDPIFDPTSSSSYSNVSCDSAACSDLVSATGIKANKLTCSTCKYRITYGDKSSSQGLLAKERLTLTSNDYIDGFVFGCGESNKGFFGDSAGMIGLGRTPLSLVSQAADKYGKYFSYCLPPSSGSTGHLTLGQGGIMATSLSYTPLLTRSGTLSFYFVDLQSISVNGRRLAISPAVFSDAGTLIDSGTVISRLPRSAYSALRTAFKQYMSSKYPTAPALSLLDTCYDLSNYTTVQVPKVTLYFGGGGILDLPATGIITLGNGRKSQACLAFAGNSDDTDQGIVGNIQQQGFDVVYDVDGGRIGFGPNAC